MSFRQKILQKKIFFFGLMVSLIILMLDRISKDLIIGTLAEPSAGTGGSYGRFDLSKLVSVVLVWNRGGSFGLFSNIKFISIFLLFVSIFTSALLIFYLWNSSGVYNSLCLSLIIGGAIGNAVDRIIYGAVVDFIDVHLGLYHWPSFNLADASIFCGAALYIASEYFRNREKY
ncbi:MAG: signal peptidase II [Rickettsiales bacterium]|jgi:signal peptidase II|nr:signal peptidase II [Rickettsiales bacterium]